MYSYIRLFALVVVLFLIGCETPKRSVENNESTPKSNIYAVVDRLVVDVKEQNSTRVATDTLVVGAERFFLDSAPNTLDFNATVDDGEILIETSEVDSNSTYQFALVGVDEFNVTARVVIELNILNIEPAVIVEDSKSFIELEAALVESDLVKIRYSGYDTDGAREFMIQRDAQTISHQPDRVSARSRVYVDRSVKPSTTYVYRFSFEALNASTGEYEVVSSSVTIHTPSSTDEPDTASDSCVHTGSGKDYRVGASQEYTKLSEVPWDSLGAGDTVRVFYKETPYTEKIIIRTGGSVDDPLKICGVKSAAGERPVIDGDGATNSPQDATAYTSYRPMEGLAVILIYNRDYDLKDSNIIIESLHIKNGKNSFSYRRSSGEIDQYEDGAACILCKLVTILQYATTS